MAKVSPIQNSFSAGEISPKLYGRVDLPPYKEGLKKCQNYIPTVQGNLDRRPGTNFAHGSRHNVNASDFLSDVYFFPFKYSRTDSYVIESGSVDPGGQEYFRFFKSHSLVTYPQTTVTNVTQANPVVVTSPGHGLSAFGGGANIRIVLSGLTGMTQLNNQEFVANSLDANNFELYDIDATLSVNGISFDAYVSGGFAARPYEIGGQFLGTPPARYEYRTAQSGDVIYFAASGRTPFKLSRYGDTNWSWSLISNHDGPFLPINKTSDVMSLVSNTITMGGIGSINQGLGWSVADIGRPIRLAPAITGPWTSCTVTACATSTKVQVAIDPNFTGTGIGPTTTPFFQIGMFPTTGNFGKTTPDAITFHEDRLWFMIGGVLASSKSGDYENFSPSDASGSVVASSGMILVLNSGEALNSSWLMSDEKGLLAGTTAGPWVIKPDSLGAALTPANASAKIASSFGSAARQPLKVDKSTIFIQSSQKKIRELLYYYDVDGYKVSDLSVLSEHISGTGLEELCFQKEPQPLIWARRTDGTLTSLTYDRNAQNIRAGWARHVLGGYSDSSHSAAALAKAITSIPSPDGLSEEVWILAHRYVNGRVRKYVEYFSQSFNENTAAKDSHHFDCALTYDSSPTTTVSGLNHLEGEVVSILADGAVRPDATVTAGKIVLDNSASTIQVGYSYQSRGQMLRLDSGAADGTALGKLRRMNQVRMLVHRTGGLKIGMDFDHLNQVNFRKASDNMGEAVPLFSGVIHEDLEGDYDSENEFCWQQDTGLPGSILAVMPQMTTQDG